MTFLRTLAFSWTSSLILVTAGTACGEETLTIPLDTIWAWDMPGTKDVSEISPVDTTLPTKETRRLSPMHDILITLNYADKNQRPAKGFVVIGSDRLALDKAREIITGKSKALSALPSYEELTLVYFSKGGCPIYLSEVSRNKHKIIVTFYTHRTIELDLGSYFALIPLGKLPKGGYMVRLQQSSPTVEPGATSKRLSAENVHRLICDSFDFSVLDTLRGD